MLPYILLNFSHIQKFQQIGFCMTKGSTIRLHVGGQNQGQKNITPKDYAAVYFVKFQSYSEVPTNWLLYDERFNDKIACRWPESRTKNITQKIKNKEAPSEEWPIHEIQILRYCSTLKSARQAAEDSQYSSAPENVGRGHRKKKVTSPVRDALSLNSKKNLIVSSSSDDEDGRTKSVSKLPQFPGKSTSENTRHSKVINEEESDSQNEYDGKSHDDNDDSEDSITRTMTQAEAPVKNFNSQQGELGASALGSHGVRNEGSDMPANRKLEDLENKMDTCLLLLGKLITEVKDLKQRSVPNNNGNTGLDAAISAEVESHLKLDTREGVAAFEARLKSSKKFEDEFFRKVKQIGGANGKDYTERALSFIFSNKFAKENTWEGKISKYKVNTLKVIDICEKIILEKFPTWDRAEFSKAGTNWFRLGNQRAGEQPKQVIKKTLNANNA